MNLRQKIVESYQNKILSSLDEQLSNLKGNDEVINYLTEAVKFKIGIDDSDKEAAVKSMANKIAVKKAQGPNTRSETLGSNQDPQVTPSKEKTKRMPLNPKGLGNKSKGTNQGVKGKTINTSKGSGLEGVKARAHQKAFNRIVSRAR